MRPAVQTSGLTRLFRWRDRSFRLHEVLALSDLSFDVAPGTACGILGPNGSGKSTLLRVLSTVLLPTSGNAWVGGRPLSDAHRIKQRLALVPCHAAGFSNRMTGRQNLEFFASLHSLPLRSIRVRLDNLLELLELGPLLEKPVWIYSSGQLQRLNFVCRILHDPDICFLDEPTRSMDPAAANSLRRWVRKELVEKQGKTVLIATHQREDVSEICDTTLVLQKGRSAWQGPAKGAPDL